jgi:uncharacterized membrane protein YbhN (UPF0104 family)
MFHKLATLIKRVVHIATANERLRWWSKLVVTIVVLVAVGITFARALQQLDPSRLEWRPGWLTLAGVVYLVALGFSMAYWWWSMVALGQRPDPLAVVRSYYIGHLGKYVPGKAMVIVMRMAMVSGPKCRPGLAALTVVYETQAFMTAGGLILGACLALGLQVAGMELWQALLIIAIAGVPTLPPVFNRIIAFVVAPFRGSDSTALPYLGYRFFFHGLFWGALAWLGLGLSLVMAAYGVLTVPDGWGWDRVPILTSKLAAATIIGFVIPLTPGGLGTREAMLLLLFGRELGHDQAALLALLLRLLWIAAEVVISVALYPLLWLRRAETPVPAPREDDAPAPLQEAAR